MTFEELENEALKLSVERRKDLARTLILSLDTDQEPDLNDGKTEPIPCEEAFRKVRASLRGSVIRYTDPLEPVALRTDPEFLELIQNSRARHTQQGGLSTSEMRRRLKEEFQE